MLNLICMYRKRWRIIQYVAEEFWNRWKEYLSYLQSSGKWVASSRNKKVDDIVMIRDDNLRRYQWKLGMVTVAEPNDDGLLRKVSLKTRSSSLDEKGKIIWSMSQLE